MEKELRNKEILNGLANVDGTQDNKEQSGNEQMIERIRLEGTPFTMVRTEMGCFGTFGRVRITDAKTTIPEVEDELRGFNWNVIVAIVIQIATDVSTETIKEMTKVTQQDKRTIDDISRGGNQKND